MFDKNGALCVVLWDAAGNPLVVSEDAAHASGDAGIMALAVRKDAAAALAGTDGDYAPLEVDANGRLHVSQSDVAKMGDKLKAVAYGDLGTNDPYPLKMTQISGGSIVQVVTVRTASGNDVSDMLGSADNGDASARGLVVDSRNRLLSGGVWERQRNNENGTALASAARTAETNSADLTNYNARGVKVFVDVTAITDTPSITVNVQEKDPVGGGYRTILASAAIGGTGLTVLTVYPGNSAAANAKADEPLPRTWRVNVAHADTDSITYSVSYSLIL